MRPLKLYINGINSFSKPAFIDFEALGEGGIFGVFGKTGSGKSTIVDAVIFSLYGDTNDSALNLSDYVNRRLTEAEVRLEFTTTEWDGSIRFYEVSRRVSVDRRTNAGKIVYAELFDITTDRMSLAVGARDVTDKIEDLLGLTLQEFSNCVVLEQNKYDNFVKSTDAERKKMVGNLFGLQRYGAQLSEEIKSRETELKLQITDLAGRIKEHADATEDAVTMLTNRYDAMQATSQKLKEAADELRKEEAVDAENYRNYEARNKILLIYDRESTAEREADKAVGAIESKRLTVTTQAQDKIAEAQTDLQELIAEEARLEASASIDDEIKAGKERIRPLERELKKIETRFDADTANIEDCHGIIVSYPDKHREMSERFRMITGIATDAADDGALQDAVSHYIGAVEEKAASQHAKLASLQSMEAALAAKAEEAQRTKTTAEQAEKLLNKLQDDKDNTKMLLEIAETNLDAARRDNSVATAIAQLHEGDKCPICGHRIETLPTVDVSDVDRLAETTEDFRRQVSVLDEKMLQVAQAYGIAKTSASNLDKEIERITGETRRMRLDMGDGEFTYDEIMARLSEIAEQAKALSKQHVKVEKEYAELTARHNADETRRKEILSGLETEQTRLTALEERRIQILGTSQTMTAALKSVTKKRSAAEAKLTLWSAKLEEVNRDWRERMDKLNVARARREAAENRLAEQPETQFEVKKFENLRARRTEMDKKERDAATELANTGVLLERLRHDYQLVIGYKQQKARLDTRYAALERIKKMTGGGKLMEWLAEEYIEDFTALASEKLSDLTGGEMELSYTGKGFYIIDNFNNRAERKVATVSGGETFLVSLSLAVAIATKLEERAGARRIEFLFVDEGFGTLSSDKIDVVMDALCSLADKDFMVGFISHVQEMQTRIPRQLIVTREDVDEGSVVRMI